MSHPLPKNQHHSDDNQSETEEKRMTPSWFSQTYRDEESEFLVDQYRRKQDLPVSSSPPDSDAYELYRKRMMERLRAQSETFGNRPMAQARPAPTTEDMRVRERAPVRQRHNSKANIKGYIMAAGLLAVVAGGSAGFALTRYDDISKSLTALFQKAPASSTATPVQILATAQEPSVVPETTISKKPISIATLRVADVSGSLNSMIPLALQADPAFATQELALQISGLPKSAYLSKGTRTSDTTWLLKDGEETGLNLFVPNSDRAKFDMSVAAIETKTGELAAPVKEMTVALDDASLQIAPASAPPETSTLKTSQPELASAIPTPEPNAVIKPELSAEVAGLLQKGDTLLKSGDLVIARQFYQRAFEMGAADGATGVARSYDPAIYAQMNVRGIAPDADLAAQWYQKAKLAGATSPPVASLP
jgi:hypothetical protein